MLNSFNGAFHPTQNLKNITLSLDDIENKMVDGLKSSFGTWKRTVQQRLFRSNISLEWDDIKYHLESVVPTKEHPDWVLSWCVLCFLNLSIHSSNFWLTRCSLVPVLRNPTRKDLLRKSMCGLLDNQPKLKVENVIDIAEQILLCTYQNAALDISDFQGKQYLDSPASLFADLVGKAIGAGLRTAVIQLLDASWTNIASHHASPDASLLMEHEAIVKGFLTQLASILELHAFPNIYSTGKMFKLLIRQYIYAAAPPYPKKLRRWAHRSRGCGCDVCIKLDAFLQSKYTIKEDFVVRDISHLKSRFPQGLIRCVHRPTEATTATVKFYRLHKIEGKEFELDVESYNKEVSAFEEYFKQLRNKYMENLIGKASYRELIMLERVKNSEGQKKLTGAATTEDEKRKASTSWGDGDRPTKKR